MEIKQSIGTANSRGLVGLHAHDDMLCMGRLGLVGRSCCPLQSGSYSTPTGLLLSSNLAVSRVLSERFSPKPFLHHDKRLLNTGRPGRHTDRPGGGTGSWCCCHSKARSGPDAAFLMVSCFDEPQQPCMSPAPPQAHGRLLWLFQSVVHVSLAGEVHADQL